MGTHLTCRPLFKTLSYNPSQQSDVQSTARAAESHFEGSRAAQADPRRVRNGRGEVAWHVAARCGHEHLTELLHPEVPFAFIFTSDDLQEGISRLYGPPRLAVLAASALQRKLVADLSALLPPGEAASAAAAAAETAAASAAWATSRPAPLGGGGASAAAAAAQPRPQEVPVVGASGGWACGAIVRAVSARRARGKSGGSQSGSVSDASSSAPSTPAAAAGAAGAVVPCDARASHQSLSSLSSGDGTVLAAGAPAAAAAAVPKLPLSVATAGLRDAPPRDGSGEIESPSDVRLRLLVEAASNGEAPRVLCSPALAAPAASCSASSVGGSSRQSTPLLGGRAARQVVVLPPPLRGGEPLSLIHI